LRNNHLCLDFLFLLENKYSSPHSSCGKKVFRVLMRLLPDVIPDPPNSLI